MREGQERHTPGVEGRVMRRSRFESRSGITGGAWALVGLCVWLLAADWLASIARCAERASIAVSFTNRLGPMNIERMALGQGGLSDTPMWADRVPEVRALHPAIIRLFIQEYFNLLPERGRYHFETLDKSVDTIMATGARPLMCICFKPRVLFPAVNQDIVEPNEYGAWEDLIAALVTHYKERGSGIRYWEVANEPDIGESGGCPYRFKPESYVRYYQHTAAAILRADPEARVGGPALAGVHSPILPALIEAGSKGVLPLHFISWHLYSSDPRAVGGTVAYARGLLAKYPALKVETFLDEWNMDLTNPPIEPGFQPCYVAETVWQLKEAGLDYSCYYHLRDWYVDLDQFTPFMSRDGAVFMARWWNRMPQFDGLFDYQNHIRPAYFTFKLLSRLGGERLELRSSNSTAHGFATYDDRLRTFNLLLWNFSAAPAPIQLLLNDIPRDLRHRHLVLNANAPGEDENIRVRPDPFVSIKKGNQSMNLELAPYAIHYWSFE